MTSLRAKGGPVTFSAQKMNWDNEISCEIQFVFLIHQPFIAHTVYVKETSC